MLDEIINYVQSLQRQVEVWKTIYSPKVEVVGMLVYLVCILAWGTKYLVLTVTYPFCSFCQ